MSINWYPGHMAKTNRILSQQLKNVDAVCELLDARIPVASRNPQLESLVKGKRKVLILNREDLADPAMTEKWLRFYRSQGFFVMKANSQNGKFSDEFNQVLSSACDDLLKRNRAKGQVGKPVRAMIIGIPNVGKSSFINRISKKRAAVAEDRPGVTKSVSWFSLKSGIELMDTPGMLWKKIDDDEVGYLLAFTGTIKDDILDREDLACRLLTALDKAAPGAVEKRYEIDEINKESPYETLGLIAVRRGFLAAGGRPDTERAADAFLADFRSGKLGRITLERAPEC